MAMVSLVMIVENLLRGERLPGSSFPLAAGGDRGRPGA
jgi:hypothetical protein